MLKRFNPYGLNIRPVVTDNLYISGSFLVSRGDYTADDGQSVETSHLTLNGEPQTFLFTSAANTDTFKFYQYSNAMLPTIDGEDDLNTPLDIDPTRSVVFLDGRLLYDTSLYSLTRNSLTIDYKALGLTTSTLVRVNIIGSNNSLFTAARFKSNTLINLGTDLNGTPTPINRYRSVLFLNDKRLSEDDIIWSAIDKAIIKNYSDGDIVTVITIPEGFGAVYTFATKDGQSFFTGYDIYEHRLEYTPYSRGTNCKLSIFSESEFYAVEKPYDEIAPKAIAASLVSQLNSRLIEREVGTGSQSQITFELVETDDELRLKINNPRLFYIRLADNFNGKFLSALGLPEYVDEGTYIGKPIMSAQNSIWTRSAISLFVSINLTPVVWSNYVQWIHQGDFVNTLDGGRIKIVSNNFNVYELMGEVIEEPLYPVYTMDFLDVYAYTDGTIVRAENSVDMLKPRMLVSATMDSTRTRYNLTLAPSITGDDGMTVADPDTSKYISLIKTPEELGQPWWLTSHENIPMTYYLTAGQKEGVYIPTWLEAISRTVVDDYHCKVNALYKQWDKKYTLDSNLVNALRTLGVDGFAFGEFTTLELRNMLEEINYFYRQVGTQASYRFTGLMTESDFGVITQLWTNDYITFQTPREIDPNYDEHYEWFPNEPIDYGLVRNMYRSVIDRGLVTQLGVVEDWGYVTDDVGGRWLKVITFNVPDGYYPTNHVRSELDYARFKELINSIATRQLFYNLASTPVVYDQVTFVINFGDGGIEDGNGDMGGGTDTGSTNTIRMGGGLLTRGTFFYTCPVLRDWMDVVDDD